MGDTTYLRYFPYGMSWTATCVFIVTKRVKSGMAGVLDRVFRLVSAEPRLL